MAARATGFAPGSISPPAGTASPASPRRNGSREGRHRPRLGHPAAPRDRAPRSKNAARPRIRREGDLLQVVDRNLVTTLGAWLTNGHGLELLAAGQLEMFLDSVVDSIVDEQRDYRRWERRIVPSELIEDIAEEPETEPEPERSPLPASWLAA